jgi:hypothetical protein
MKIYHGTPQYYDDGPDRRALLDHPFRFGQVDYRQHQCVGIALQLNSIRVPFVRLAQRLSATFTSPAFKDSVKRFQKALKKIRPMIDNPKREAHDRSRRDMQEKRRAARRNDPHKPKGAGR